MMIDIYVLDGNLNPVGIVDAYKSLIWASRYAKVGDCELYLAATSANLGLLRVGRYLCRLDDAMVCRIDRLELDTDAEDGNYIIANGVDVKAFLDQRIVWDTATCKGKVEVFARKLVKNSMIESEAARNLKKTNGDPLLKLGTYAGLTDTTEEQVSYKVVGEKVREYCATYGWGYRVRLDGDIFAFEIYKGTDRRSEVVFSDAYENLASTKYVDDQTDIKNVCLVAGEGEGADRTRGKYGSASGTARYEIFADAKDISKSITYAELTADYPGGAVEEFENAYAYRVASVDVQIIGAWHLSWLIRHFPTGSVVTVDGVEYYRVANAILADLDTAEPDDTTQVVIRNIIYMPYLMTRAAEKIAEHGAVQTFEGSVIPDVTFRYKQDYFLGDIVMVKNEFGITQPVRITEVIEVQDGSGYSFQPKFENVR